MHIFQFLIICWVSINLLTVILGYRSYEQFERATAFQKSMSVQAIDMSDELLLAKQEYLQQYDANNNGAPLQRSASYFEGSNSIVAEKKRGRGDSIRKGS